MDINKIIKDLKSLDDNYAWFSDTESNDIQVITSQGLYEGFSLQVYPIEGPFILPEESYRKLSENDENDEDDDLLEDEDYDEFIMFKAGCEPEIEYYKYSADIAEDEDFYERDVIVDDFVDKLIENEDPVPWEDVDEEELMNWHEILKLLKKGYTSWDEVPESLK
jgi:hypothetical protein